MFNTNNNPFMGGTICCAQNLTVLILRRWRWLCWCTGMCAEVIVKLQCMGLYLSWFFSFLFTAKFVDSKLRAGNKVMVYVRMLTWGHWCNNVNILKSLIEDFFNLQQNAMFHFRVLFSLLGSNWRGTWKAVRQNNGSFQIYTWYAQTMVLLVMLYKVVLTFASVD